MNTPFPLPRSILSGLALLLLLPSVATWQLFSFVKHQRAEVQHLRTELEIATAEKEVVQSRIDEIQADLESAESSPKPTDSGTTRAPRSQSSPSAQGDPWATPPEVLPDWNPSSPYIWMSRESLATLPIQPFYSLGKLDGDVVEILGIDPGLAKELHSTCADILRRREALETELAVASFPGPSTNRMQLEVQFPTDTAAELQASFEGAIRHSLGTQRAELILTLGRSWIDEQFSPTKSVTVTLLPGGKYEISSTGGGIFRSFGGVGSLDGFMPAHFAARFNAHFDSLKLDRGKDSETDKTPERPRE